MSNRGEINIGKTRFDLRSRDLTDASGTRIPLRNKCSEVLAVLAARPGAIVTKNEIMASVWPDTTVGEESLTQCIAEIRKATGDTEQTLLKTHIGKGYSLEVTAPNAAGPGRNAALIAAGLAALGMLAALTWTVIGDEPPASPPRVAILAFDDLSVDGERGYLSDGIAEGVITELAYYSEFDVIARNSSFSFRDGDMGIQEISAALDADYVVEGSLQKSGDKLRVTAQLIDGETGAHIWANEYDREIGELFDVQSEIVRSISRNVGRTIRLTGPPRGGEQAVTALHLFLEGKAASKERTRQGRLRSRDLFQQAIEADPEASFGYVGMTEFLWFDILWEYTDTPRDEKMREATRYAERALSLDAGNWYAHVVRADIHVQAGELEQAVVRYRNAHELNPSAATSMVAMTDALVMLGQTDEALEVMERAISLDPIYPDWYDWQLAWVLWSAERCGEGVDVMKRMATIPPNAQRLYAVLNACAGRMDVAKTAMSAFLAENPRHTLVAERDRASGMWNRLPHQLERWIDHQRLAGMPEG